MRNLYRPHLLIFDEEEKKNDLDVVCAIETLLVNDPIRDFSFAKKETLKDPILAKVKIIYQYK